MSTRKVFWPEIMRVWAQWVGIGVAAVPAGLTFGVLLRNGIDEKAALAISLVIGFVLSLTCWIWIARHIAVKPDEYTTGVSSNPISLEPMGAFAVTAILCLTLAGQPADSNNKHAVNSMGNDTRAISQL
jgi:hypothetical protein